jgi:hypothetical protein
MKCIRFKDLLRRLGLQKVEEFSLPLLIRKPQDLLEAPSDFEALIFQEDEIHCSVFLTTKILAENRYGSGHWSEDQYPGGFYGFLGEQIFESLLTELRIEHLRANPIYREFSFRSIENKAYDFYVGEKTFELKTTPPNATLDIPRDDIAYQEKKERTRLLIPAKRWHRSGSDYVVAMKIESYENRTATLYGFLEGHEVPKLPKKSFGRQEAYWTFLDPNKAKKEGCSPLKPASELISLLFRLNSQPRKAKWMDSRALDINVLRRSLRDYIPDARQGFERASE